MVRAKNKVMAIGYPGPYEELAAAIVEQACHDYIDSGRDEKVRREIESFFLSDWCKFLTKIDGQKIIDACREKIYSGSKMEYVIIDVGENKNETQ